MTSHREAPYAKTWSSLPLEILNAIGKCLDSGIDIFSFRSVCKKWRSSLHTTSEHRLLSPFLPCKFINPSLPFNDRPHDHLLLVARSVLLVSPLHSSFYSYDLEDWILTVEEMTPGKLRILYPLSDNYVEHLPSNFPKYLDLWSFEVCEISKIYRFKYASDGKDVAGVQKVVLCSHGSTAMVLYGEGILVGVRLKNGKWSFVRHSLLTSIADMINGRGFIYAVDCKGYFYSIDYKTMKVIRVVECKLESSSPSKPRLLESNGDYYFVGLRKDHNSYSCVNIIITYYLDKLTQTWVVTTMGLFLCISTNDCFFVQHLSRGCVLYSFGYIKCSDVRNGRSISEGTNLNLQVGVVDKWEDDVYSTTMINWQSIANMLWPPPTWFWNDTYSSSGEDDDCEELDFSNNQDSSVIQRKEVLPPSFTLEKSSQAATNNKQGFITNVNGIPVHRVRMGDSHSLRVQVLNHSTSSEIFEGVSIKCNFVPTLQDIWTKHGNVLEETTIRNGDLIARALESLATTVQILKSSSGRSLNEAQAEYLSSALSDLKQMHLKVDWLAPFVEKALAVNKSKSLIDSLNEYSKAKALAQGMKLKVLDELAKLDEVEEDMMFVFEKIPILEAVDLDKSLGEGLC